MSRHARPVVVPAEVDAGAETDLSTFNNGAEVLLRGTFSATYQIQVAIVPNDWMQLGADITAEMTTPWPVPDGATAIRVNTTVWASGSAACIVSGEGG